MAIFTFKQKNVYYDVTGSGKPILLLNGIMMSTLSWEPFVKSLSNQNMLIRVDFLDQGKTDCMDDIYEQSIQVELIKRLLDHLKIEKVSIVGISYGGEVAISFGVIHQSYLERLILFNTTAYTSEWLKDIGRSWIAVGKTKDGSAYYKTTIPVIYSSSFYQKEISWMRKREEKLTTIFSNETFLKRMERLIISAESYNEYDKVSKITVPTLIVASHDDNLTPKDDQALLHNLIKNSHFIEIPNSGHASMYEKPLLFVTLVLGFINALETEYII